MDVWNDVYSNSLPSGANPPLSSAGWSCWGVRGVVEPCQCTPLVPGGLSSLFFFKENFLQVYFPPDSLSLRAWIIISVAPKWTSLIAALPLITRQLQNCFQIVPQLGFAPELLGWVRHGKKTFEKEGAERRPRLGTGGIKRWRVGWNLLFSAEAQGSQQKVGSFGLAEWAAGPGTGMWSSTGRQNLSHLWLKIRLFLGGAHPAWCLFCSSESKITATVQVWNGERNETLQVKLCPLRSEK